MDASSDFYTRIPHVFGMSRPPVIDNNELLKEKLSLIEVGREKKGGGSRKPHGP